MLREIFPESSRGDGRGGGVFLGRRAVLTIRVHMKEAHINFEHEVINVIPNI